MLRPFHPGTPRNLPKELTGDLPNLVLVPSRDLQKRLPTSEGKLNSIPSQCNHQGRGIFRHSEFLKFSFHVFSLEVMENVGETRMEEAPEVGRVAPAQARAGAAALGEALQEECGGLRSRPGAPELPKVQSTMLMKASLENTVAKHGCCSSKGAGHWALGTDHCGLSQNSRRAIWGNGRPQSHERVQELHPRSLPGEMSEAD